MAVSDLGHDWAYFSGSGDSRRRRCRNCMLFTEGTKARAPYLTFADGRGRLPLRTVCKDVQRAAVLLKDVKCTECQQALGKHLSNGKCVYAPGYFHGYHCPSCYKTRNGPHHHPCACTYLPSASYGNPLEPTLPPSSTPKGSNDVD